MALFISGFALGWATCLMVIVYPMVKKEGERYK